MAQQLTSAERDFIVQVIRKLKTNGKHIMYAEVLQNFALLGAGLDIEDAKLRTGEHQDLTDFPSARNAPLQSELGLPMLDTQEREWVKETLIEVRSNGGKATITNLRETFDLLGYGLPFHEATCRQNDIHEMFSSYPTKIGEFVLVTKREREENPKNEGDQGHQNEQERARKALKLQENTTTAKPAALEGAKKDKHRPTTPAASTYRASTPEPLAPFDFGGLPMPRDLTTESETAGQGHRHSVTGFAPHDNTIRTGAYNHNPLYNSATGSAELTRLIANDCVTFRSDSVHIHGPLYQVLFGNVRQVMGAVADNNTTEAVEIVNDVETMLNELKGQAGIPHTLKHLCDNGGVMYYSPDAMTAEHQRFMIHDICRKILRMIIVERTMVWIKAGHPTGSASTQAINLALKAAGLNHMVLQYKESAPYQLRQPRGGHTGPTGGSRGSGGRGGYRGHQ